MSPLRKQLHAARSEYRGAQYPGDLASLVLPDIQASWRWDPRRLGIGAGLAAAAMITIVVGLSIRVAGQPLTAARMQAWLPSFSDVPKMPPRAKMAGAINIMTPPEVPDLLMDVKQPLVSSGQFIVEIGKDIAHHADALFHMG